MDRKFKIISIVLAASLLVVSVGGCLNNFTPENNNPSKGSFYQIPVKVDDVVNKFGRLSIVVHDDKNNEFIIESNNKFLIVNRKTAKVMKFEDLKTGDLLTLYTKSPVKKSSILFSILTPSVVVLENENDIGPQLSLKVDKFDENGLSSDKTMQILNTKDSKIIRQNGASASEDDLFPNNLIILYDIVTSSLPAQTNPIIIIILDE